MKKAILATMLIFTLLKVSGQHEHVFYSPDSGRYSTTNFSNTDSLSCWFYVLMNSNPGYTDSVRPVARLIFQRRHPVDDHISNELFNKGWLPGLTFYVYNFRDSVYCLKKSRLLRMVSSCIAPDVGGDIIFMGKYIFLNQQVCVNCKRYDTGIDYCRPVINKMFLLVDKLKIGSLKEIVEQFSMQGQVIDMPR